jgi:putative drug exporter of the RND superfamily
MAHTRTGGAGASARGREEQSAGAGQAERGGGTSRARAPGSPRRGLAAALGGWSAQHRKTAIGVWLLFVVAATVLGGAVGRVGLPSYRQGAGDSARAEQILAHANINEPATELVLVRSDAAAVTAASPAFRHAVGRVLAEINGTHLVQDVADPYADHLVSGNGRDALVRFQLRGADSTVGTVLAAVSRARAASPGFTMTETGDASAQQALNNNISTNFGHAEWTAVPLAIGVLLVVFGALMAAVLPVLLALTAFVASVGLADLLSHLVGLNSYANSVMLLMGLAVGVDYSLFYLFRERQERAAGRDRAGALQVAAATSGRSVLVSGLIVMTGMVGMLLSGMATFEGLGLAAMVVVFVAMLGSVTVLPALLSLLGDRVELGRIPLPGGRRRRVAAADGTRRGGAWDVVMRRVLARPVLFAAASAAIMLGLAAPALGMRTQTLSLGQLLPWNSSQASATRQIAAEFPGGPAPAQVVIKARDIQAPRVRRAIASFEAAALRAGDLRQPVQVSVYKTANVAEIGAPLPGNGSDAASVAALTALRGRLIPQTLGRVPGVQALTDGALASSLDYNAALRSAAIRAFAIVMVAAFVLMLASLGSVVIAATCVLLDLLSVGAAYGVMTAIFVHGWGAALVGTHAVGAIESWIPLFLFVVLFGLSMDYHVFVVSRIREARDRGMTTAQAVSAGIRSTAAVVTSAAVIMVAVFAVFGTLSMQDFKQLGVGLAVAILLDATLIRVVLLPSVMALLGDRNWYLPRWLAWLPRISHATAEPPGPAVPSPAAGPAQAWPSHAGARS